MRCSPMKANRHFEVICRLRNIGSLSTDYRKWRYIPEDKTLANYFSGQVFSIWNIKVLTLFCKVKFSTIQRHKKLANTFIMQ
jgi:hypothetical protein